MDKGGGEIPPSCDNELNQTLDLLKLQHDQTMEMFDKLLELKKIQLQMIKESKTNEISNSSNTD